MTNKFLRNYCKLKATKDELKVFLKSNKGEIDITISKAIWVVVAVLVVVLAWGFYAGWLPDVFDRIQQVFTDRTDSMVN